MKLGQVREIAIISSLISIPTILFFLIPIARPALIFDEITYSVQSRIDPDSLETHGYLYSHIVNLATACDPQLFFDCGRFVSVPFISLQTMMIYLFARRYLDTLRAFLLSIGSLLLSTTIWAYLFTPESIHFALSIVAFLLMAIALSQSNDRKWLALLIAAAVVFGLASLVKVHTVLVVPALMLVVVNFYRARGGSVRAAFFGVAGFMATFFATRFLVGFLLAGPKGITLLGGYQSTLIDSLLGSSAPVDERSAEGVYFGIGERTFSGSGYDFSDLPYLVSVQAWTMAPIILLAFGAIFMMATFRPAPDRESEDRTIRLRAIFLSTLYLLANLFLLAIGFGAFVTALGDNHIGRPLFRYVEYGLVLSLVTGLVYLLSIDNFDSSRGKKTRLAILLAIVGSLFLGGQRLINPGYADSSFVPVLGRPEFWIPLVITSMLLGMLFLRIRRPVLRSSLIVMWIIPFLAAGVTANAEYLTGASQENNPGSKTGVYLRTGPDPRGEKTLFLGTGTLGFGTAMAEAQFDQKHYRLVLGSTPADLSLVPDDYEYVVAFGGVIVSDETGEWDLFQDLEESYVLVRNMGERQTSPLANPKNFSPHFQYDYFGSGAFYTATGGFEFVFQRNLREGDEIEMCFVPLPEIERPQAVLSFGRQSIVLSIPAGGETCLSFAIATGENTNILSLESNTALLELEDGTVVGELGIGISRVLIVD